MQIRKWFPIICLSSAAIIIACGMLPQNAPKSSFTQLKATTWQQEVVAGGEIRETISGNILATSAGIVENITVSSGDAVKKGDKVAVIQSSTTSMDELPTSLPMSGVKISENSYAAYLERLGNDSYETENVQADCDGKIEDVLVTQGSFIEKGEPIATLKSSEETSDYYVSLMLPESQAGLVQTGQNVRITGTAFEQELFGSVETISDTAKLEYSVNSAGKEAIVPAEVKIESPCNAILRSGYTAKAFITVSQPETVNILPYRCVFQKTDGEDIQSYVYTFDKGRASAVRVITGRDLPSGVEIISGLNPTDIVLTDIIDIKEDDWVILHEDEYSKLD